jgi:DNA-binding MarR family transcriptional regulator
MSVAAPDRRAAALTELREGFGCLLGAERRLRGRDQHRKEGDGLTTSQVRALFALDARKEATPGQIAEIAQLSPGGVTGMLDDLERDGIVTRVRSDTDRRRVLVTLTDDGRTLLSKKRRAWSKRWESTMAEIPDADLEAAATVMRRIGAMLDEI